jgi:hypothetical protein
VERQSPGLGESPGAGFVLTLHERDVKAGRLGTAAPCSAERSGAGARTKGCVQAGNGLGRSGDCRCVIRPLRVAVLCAHVVAMHTTPYDSGIIRTAVVTAAEQTSMAAMAGELAIGVDELRAFLNGADPSSATAQRLTIWHRFWGNVETMRERDAALTILSGYYPATDRERARGGFKMLLYEEAENSASVAVPLVS